MMKTLAVKVLFVAVAALVAPVRAGAVEIASAVVNRDANGEVTSVTLDIRAGQGETAAIFRLSGATAGEPKSTNGWEKVEWVGYCTASASRTFAVPDGWGETAKAMSFILVDSEVYSVCKSLKTPQEGTADTTPYVNTKVIPTDKTRIHIKFNAPKDTCMFGLKGRFGFFTNVGATIFPVFQNLVVGEGQTGRPSIADCDVELTFGSGAYDNGDGTTSVGDTVVRTGGKTDSTKLGEQSDVVVPEDPITTPLPLFRRLNYNTTEASKIALNATLYFAQIFEDDEMIRDFVPVCTSDGTAALLDRCSHEVYGSANSGAFLFGKRTGEIICNEPLRVVDGTLAYSASEDNGIRSATVNRDADGKIASVTLDIRIGQGETAWVFRLSGSTAGRSGSTNGWEKVEWVGFCTASASRTFAVPDGWGETVKAMSFILSDSKVYGVCKSLKTPQENGVTPYINTGVIPTDKTRIHIKFNAPKDTCMFGLKGRFGFFTHDGATIWPVFQNLGDSAVGQTGRPSIADCDVELTFGSGAYDNGDGTTSVGDTVVRTGGATDSSKLGEQSDVVLPPDDPITTPLPLFRRLNYNTRDYSKIALNATLYYAQIFEDGEMIRDFVPVRAPDGTAALFDRCSHEPYGSANSGAFLLGDSTGEVVSDGPLHVIDKTPTYTADDEPVGTGVIRSMKVKRYADGTVQFATLSLAVPPNQTNVLYCACGATAGAADSTAGWESVTQIGLVTGDTTLRCFVPQGWGRGAKVMRFFLSDPSGGEWLPVCASLASTANGGEYVSTGVIPTDKTRICIEYLTPSKDVCAFGLTDRFYYFENNKGAAYLGFQNLSNGGYKHQLSGNRLNVTFGSEAVQNVDGGFSPGVTTANETGRQISVKLGEQSDVVDQKDITSSVSLFARMGRNSTELTKTGASTIYWARFYENDLMVRDLVPVLDGDRGALIDRCSGRLYYNEGGGALVAGSRTGELQPTTIHVVSASGTVTANPGGFMIILK